jgi:transposase
MRDSFGTGALFSWVRVRRTAAGPARDVRQAALGDADGVLHLLRGVEDVHRVRHVVPSDQRVVEREHHGPGEVVGQGPSRRVHSRYCRRLDDAPIAGRPVQLRLQVRRFFCDNSGCPSRTFAEQPAELTASRARRTLPLRRMLVSIAVALAGRAGVRLAERLGVLTSRDSLLRLLRTLPDPQSDLQPDGQDSRLLGIDDFALRRGHVYGTVVVDMLSGRPLDLLPDRQSGTVAAWLQERPEVEVICRDRAGAYAEAAALAAPQAVQVADRWHLWHNLAGHLERVVLAHRRCVRELPPPGRTDNAGPTTPADATAATTMAADGAATDGSAPVPELWIVTRTRERYQTISELRTAGKSIAQIARELGLDRRTVRRFARATSEEELQVKNRQRPTVLDDYADYLHRRWAEGCTDAAATCTRCAAGDLFRRGGSAQRAAPADRELDRQGDPQLRADRPGRPRRAGPASGLDLPLPHPRASRRGRRGWRG